MTAADLGQSLPFPMPSETLRARLASRRSAPAQALTDPGPTADQIAAILELGARTPDHGKLFPWRFVVLGRRRRTALAAAFAPLAARQLGSEKALKTLSKLTAAPATVLVISSPVEGHKVPVWEQRLSAGAVCMNLEHAAGAFGFATSWITDWYSYDADSLALLGVGDGEQVAGFIHIGSATETLLERPRPDVAAITSYED